MAAKYYFLEPSEEVSRWGLDGALNTPYLVLSFLTKCLPAWMFVLRDTQSQADASLTEI